MGEVGHDSSQPSPHSASSPSRSQMTVIGLLRMRLRALYLLLAAEGGVRDRPYFGPTEEGDVDDEPKEYRGIIPSLRAQSSGALLLRLGEAQGLSGLAGSAGSSEESSERVLWKRGSVLRNISAADMRKLVSERLPFFSSSALKVSLLVADLRRLRCMELVCLGRDELSAGHVPVGVTGGDEG